MPILQQPFQQILNPEYVCRLCERSVRVRTQRRLWPARGLLCCCHYFDFANFGFLLLPFQIFDTDQELQAKAQQLAEWIRASKHCVLYCGAGLSTAAGIPDFRYF